jgi:hypothetical protein
MMEGPEEPQASGAASVAEPAPVPERWPRSPASIPRIQAQTATYLPPPKNEINRRLKPGDGNFATGVGKRNYSFLRELTDGGIIAIGNVIAAAVANRAAAFAFGQYYVCGVMVKKNRAPTTRSVRDGDYRGT